ncbi:hypothetical protein GCM10020358_69050 [Amorphoplanes nipponensis]|uniref:Uncharacterized protein n=1 Tax=Actinoplanes nipponensis TaxID=135950 RepID=A0A919JLG6_9ACTN|nr:hypothetical protein [Actinoplanes nipponensis]GIE53204.1 hypothetical protein Ani05nite_67380 [Actinoplanes nipponensis]
MTIIGPTTDLTPFVDAPVVFTREFDGRIHHYEGTFTSLAHSRDHVRPEFRRDDAGGMFEYVENGQRKSTGMHVPYGSTIEVTA